LRSVKIVSTKLERHFQSLQITLIFGACGQNKL